MKQTNNPLSTTRPESPHEAAARVADKWAEACTTPEDRGLAREIAHEIRALPHPPERVLPVFTAEEISEHSAGTGLSWSQRIADYINTRIAASGFAQSGPVDTPDMQPSAKKPSIIAQAIYEDIKHGDEEHQRWLKDRLEAFFERNPKYLLGGKPISGPVDLEKMQEAVDRAWDAYEPVGEVRWASCAGLKGIGAKYLAAEGFRLGDAPGEAATSKVQESPMDGKSRSIEERMMLASNGGCTCGVKTHVASYHDELCHYRIFEDAQEIIKLKDARIEAEKARIDAAVLAERERVEQNVLHEISELSFTADNDIETAKMDGIQMAFEAVRDFFIRARTTNTEIAGGPITPAKEGAPASAPAAGESPAPDTEIAQPPTGDPAVTTSLPVTEGDAGRAPQTAEPRKVVQVCVVPETERSAYAVYALCNDGTMLYYTVGIGWRKMPPIPQPGETP